jgi:type I restriction enzyme S subunit
MSELPKGWEISTLGGLGIWSSGGTPSRKNPEYYGGLIPWVKTGDLQDGYIESTEEFLTDIGLKNSSAKLFPAGTLLLAMYGATIGRTGLLKIDAATNQACAALIADGLTKKLIPFLRWFLIHKADEFKAIGQGGAQPNISQTLIKQFPIALPPLNEQRRIVAKLDRIFARSRRAREELGRVSGLCDRYKQAVLAAAFHGDLTADWRRNSILAPKNDFIDTHLPNDWEVKLVREVGSVQLGRQRAPKYHAGQHMRPYLRVQNIFENKIDLSDVMEMNFSPDDFDRYQLHPGDILLNEGQSPEFLGRPAMYRGELPGACFTNTLIRFCAFDIVDPDFALLVFRHYLHSGRFRKEGTITTNIAHLGAGRFSNIEFPLPSLDEQKKIVQRVEKLFKAIDRIEQEHQKASKLLDRLEQATLAKAFRGELVPQDPNDEPAAVLLERIRAERQALPKGKAVKSRKLRS